MCGNSSNFLWPIKVGNEHITLAGFSDWVSNEMSVVVVVGRSPLVTATP